MQIIAYSIFVSRNLIQAWVADAAPLIDLVQRPDASKHPLLRRTVSDATIASVVRLWDEQEHFFHLLEQLPQTLCHQDVWRKNLLHRQSPDGKEETVALDWELVGIGVAGEDVGNLYLA
jgi:aminoglycoside phosphotransferase (APT) family kinase protein